MYSENKVTLRDRREMLRVKVKSLAAESRIIRKEELRTHGVLREELQRHRVLIVRAEARAAHLAYGLIRGRTVEQMERTCRTALPAEKVRQLLKKYGPKTPTIELKIAA